MLNPSIESPGEWFSCLNVGDDYEEKDDRRKEKDLVIPGFSLVEIVGIRRINDDHFVHEIRLPKKRILAGTIADENFIGSDYKYAFTGPGDILKLHKGRMKFAPAMCRFEGETYVDANAKIFGRYKAPERQSGGRYTPEEYDYFELQEKLFGDGQTHHLLADPKGHLKLPQDVNDSEQQFLTGWSVLGVYKYNTGEKTKGKKDDEDQTKNLLAYVAPAAAAPPPSVIFMLSEPITNEIFQAGNVSVVFLEYVDPRSTAWNHKFMLDFSGVFGWEYAFTISDGLGTVLGPFLISTDGSDIQAALEAQPWCGVGNVSVQSPGPLSGRFIIEFIGELSGIRQYALYWQRVVTLSDPPENILNAVDIPEIVQYPLIETDYRILPGSQKVQITPASKPMNWRQLYYGQWGAYNGWNYGYGYYPGGDYGYYGGWGGGPWGYLGGLYGTSYYNPFYATGYSGPTGTYYEAFIGPYDFDANGNPSPGGGYNTSGFDANGFNAAGFDPYGFDINGLNVNGYTWAYYGVWGHLHTGEPGHDNVHKNDHGIVNAYNNLVYQHNAAGSFGVANWVRGGGYVVVELESRDFVLDTATSIPARPASAVVY
ncbi:MAG: hypothetical protein ABIK07_24790 [Planctomycetota bacterium]